MSTNQRGCLYLSLLVVFGFFACILFPFFILPSVGTAVSLPVITVPSEYYVKDWPSPNFVWVNSLGGALLANIVVLLVAFRARAVSKAWTQEVPGRFQGFVELIGEMWWNLTKDQAGTKPKVKYILFPLVASIFFFLLAGNLGKILPGVETVGVLHCAAYQPVALNGFPIHQIDVAGTSYFVLRNDAVLNTGTTGTNLSYHQCEAGIGEHLYIQEGYLVTELDPYFDAAVVHTTVEGDTLASILDQYNADAQALMSEPLPESAGRDTLQQNLANGDYAAVSMNYDDLYAQYAGWQPVSFTLEGLALANDPANGGELPFTFANGNASNTGEHANSNATSTQSGTAVDVIEAANMTINGTVYTLPQGVTVDTPLEVGQEIVMRPQLLGEQATTRLNQLYTVSPFVRGVSTDLSFTIGLALLAFFAIQAFGVSELGIGYFNKFINVHALGNIAKNPIGGIDFIVGLFEIISEFGKIISLSFRLFGSLFAGSVLYAVIMFLVGTTVPVIILALELIVGIAQAGVFAVLTLLFCAQAMVNHQHDEEHGE